MYYQEVLDGENLFMMTKDKEQYQCIVPVSYDKKHKVTFWYLSCSLSLFVSFMFFFIIIIINQIMLAYQKSIPVPPFIIN